MDFDIAAQRLRKDQQSALARSRASRNARTSSAKAKREAAAARQRAQRRLKEKRLEGERNARVVDGVTRSVGRAERGLGVANVAVVSPPASDDNNKPNDSALFPNGGPLARGWTFAATSIHGEGDKIALPPSVLETMTSGSNDLDPWGGGRNGRPIAFRVGILNPEYAFPSSRKMKELVEGVKRGVITSEKGELARETSTFSEASNDRSTNGDMNDHDDDDETDDSTVVEAYLDELSHRYLSYTHGTVVEFTQEDGRVGLPEPIARALLRPNVHSLAGNNDATTTTARGESDIPARRTVDPAAGSAARSDGKGDGSNGSDGAEDAMDVDADNNITGEVDTGERTPGHPAYGLFDIPALPIEVIPVNSLPPGANCTFTPTSSSIHNGFYALKDVKSVLEQSLMRTRATLSRGDVIRTWRRGVSFDLIVSELSPAGYGAVSCINTNLNVDIGPPEGGDDEIPGENASAPPEKEAADPVGGGRTLAEPSSPSTSRDSASPPVNAAQENLVELPPEPPANAKEGVCNVQIRGRTPSGNSATGRRRFDVAAATVSDLFAFASQICDAGSPSGFRLVTRFPRRVFRLSSPGGGEEGGESFATDATLESAGIGQGQEMFMVETV